MENENNLIFYKYSENGIKSRNYDLWNSINNYITDDISFKEKFYLYENSLLSKPICYCGNTLKFNDMKTGFKSFCSKRCMYNSQDIKNNRKETNIKKYGVDNPSKLQIFKDKVKVTNNIKFGVDYPLQSIDKMNDLKLNFVEKYGVDNPSKIKEVREKAENTMLERYGVKHAMDSDFIKSELKEYFIDKYGVDNPSKIKEVREKAENTMLERYGVKHALQNKDIVNKMKETNLERYGFEYASQSDEIKNKSRETNLERYGFDNPSKSYNIKEKIKESILKKFKTLNLNSISEISNKIENTNNYKYGEKHISKSHEYRLRYKISQHVNYINYIDNGISLFICDCNEDHEFKISIDNYISRQKNKTSLCTICYPIKDNVSIKELELLKYIKSIYSGEIITSYRDKLEIDIYLPEFKIGFEFNGLYWHSDVYKDKNYHLNKTNYFKEMGIRIIHIWEDDWDLKKDIIKSQVKNWIGLTDNKIFARVCLIKEITDVKLIKSFLNQNHIQGFANNKISIGLYINDELINIMIFDKNEGRVRMKETEWNISRFCNKIGYNVVGGASKILKYFIKTYKPNRIISYADNDWSVGNLYYKLGFTNVSVGRPDYKYIINGQRVHKGRYRKSKIGIKDLPITESEYTKSIGINRIYDCGKIKFELLM